MEPDPKNIRYTSSCCDAKPKYDKNDDSLFIIMPDYHTMGLCSKCEEFSRFESRINK
jgi:hypothetical protein